MNYKVMRGYRGEQVQVATFDTVESARTYIRQANDREKCILYWISYPKVYADNDILPALAAVYGPVMVQ